MKQLIAEMMKPKRRRYRVTIKGISDSLSSKYYYTMAESDSHALSLIVGRILKEADKPGSTLNKRMYYDGRVKIPLTPERRQLLVAYLESNPHLFTIQRMLR
jgi:hypothetical protein